MHTQAIAVDFFFLMCYWCVCVWYSTFFFRVSGGREGFTLHTKMYLSKKDFILFLLFLLFFLFFLFFFFVGRCCDCKRRCPRWSREQVPQDA